MTYTFIARACTDLPVSACCRVMRVSTSGFYAWQAHPVRSKDLDDAYLSDTIVDIWTMSRRSYGSPRVHAELKLGLDVRCSRKRVERLMRQAGIAGIHRRRRGGCTRRDLDAEPSDDLVKRAFDPTEPDRLWVMDVTEHPTEDGKAYLAVVLDAFSRRVVGWSIADHMRTELVVDALQMAIWRRRPPAGQTIAHSDHGSTYTSWAFGRRLRGNGLLGSMGSIGDCFDNSRRRELLRHPPARAARRTPLGEPPATGPGHLRVDRSLVQPAATPQLLQDAQSRGLRSRTRGMISNQQQLSAGAGEAHPADLGPIQICCSPIERFPHGGPTRVNSTASMSTSASLGSGTKCSGSSSGSMTPGRSPRCAARRARRDRRRSRGGARRGWPGWPCRGTDGA